MLQPELNYIQIHIEKSFVFNICLYGPCFFPSAFLLRIHTCTTNCEMKYFEDNRMLTTLLIIQQYVTLASSSKGYVPSHEN